MERNERVYVGQTRAQRAENEVVLRNADDQVTVSSALGTIITID